MLITKELKSIAEKYFTKHKKDLELIENGGFFETKFDEKMFNIIKKIIEFYKKDLAKSSFIKNCIINHKSWSDDIYDIFYIERRTYFMWKEEILSDAVVFAIQDGLIFVGEDNIEDT